MYTFHLYRKEVKHEVAETHTQIWTSTDSFSSTRNFEFFRKSKVTQWEEAVCQHTYLVDVIFISIASVSSALSSSVDLTLVAGLRRQTVLVITTLQELAWETWAWHAVTGWKQQQSLVCVSYSEWRHLVINTSCFIVNLCPLTPVQLCRNLQDSHTGSLRQCWSSRRCRGWSPKHIHSHLGIHRLPAQSQSQRDTHTCSCPVCCSRRRSHTLSMPGTRFHLQRREEKVQRERQEQRRWLLRDDKLLPSDISSWWCWRIIIHYGSPETQPKFFFHL